MLVSTSLDTQWPRSTSAPALLVALLGRLPQRVEPTAHAHPLAARGETPAAFDGRSIPAGCVAPPSNIPEYSQSSRLASRAPRPSRCDAGLSPRAASKPLLPAVKPLLPGLNVWSPALSRRPIVRARRRASRQQRRRRWSSRYASRDRCSLRLEKRHAGKFRTLTAFDCHQLGRDSVDRAARGSDLVARAWGEAEGVLLRTSVLGWLLQIESSGTGRAADSLCVE
jgi:hypothetical protein